jgi:hypothetical protein
MFFLQQPTEIKSLLVVESLIANILMEIYPVLLQMKQETTTEFERITLSIWEQNIILMIKPP